jgi:hypothetical protein
MFAILIRLAGAAAGAFLESGRAWRPGCRAGLAGFYRPARPAEVEHQIRRQCRAQLRPGHLASSLPG